jgi:hypothetical protein
MTTDEEIRALLDRLPGRGGLSKPDGHKAIMRADVEAEGADTSAVESWVYAVEGELRSTSGGTVQSHVPGKRLGRDIPRETYYCVPLDALRT